MADLGTLLLGVRVNETDLESSLQDTKSTVQRNLANLNTNNALRIKVDDSRLYDLNKHFKLKQVDYLKLQKLFDSKPLTIRYKVDDRALKQTFEKYKTINVSATGGRSDRSGFDSQGIIQQLQSNQKSANSDVGNLLKALNLIGKNTAQKGFIQKALSIPFNFVGKIGIGALEGLGRDLSRDISKGLSDGIKRELSYSIGSMEFLGREIGSGLAKGIINSFGRDIELLEKIVTDTFGKQAIVTEGAAVRAGQYKESQTRKRSASQQIQREYGFVEENFPELQKQGAKLQKQRAFLKEKGLEITKKVTDYADKLGQKALEQRSNQISLEISKLVARTQEPLKLDSNSLNISQLQNAKYFSQRLGVSKAPTKGQVKTVDTFIKNIRENQPQSSLYTRGLDLNFSTFQDRPNEGVLNFNSKQQQQNIKSLVDSSNLKRQEDANKRLRPITNKISALSTKRRQVSDAIDDVFNQARERYRKELDSLAKLDDQVLAEEREFAQTISAIDNIEFAEKPKAIKNKVKNVKALSQKAAKKQSQFDTAIQFYEDIFNEVLTLSGIDPTTVEKPKLTVDKGLRQGSHGVYRYQSNEIAVRPETISKINSGEITEEIVEVFLHEFRHSVQLAFGNLNPELEQSNIPLIKPTAQESRKLGRYIEFSTQGGTNNNASNFKRQLEADAYTFASRNREAVFKKLAREQIALKFESKLGVGGGNIENKLVKAQLKVYELINQAANSFAVDLSSEIQEVEGKISEVVNNFSELLDEFSDLDNIDPSNINQVIKAIEDSFLSAKQELVSLANTFSSTGSQKRVDIKNQLYDLLPTLSYKKELLPIARQFGIQNPEKMRKQQLYQELVENQDLRQLQPKVFDITRSKAQARAARAEKLQEVAYQSGRFAKGVTAVTGKVVGPLAATGLQAIKGTAEVSKAFYQLAKATEKVTLDIIPLAHAAKWVTRHLVIPGAGVYAATHMLPGAGAAMEGLTHVAGGALGNVAEGPTQALLNETLAMIRAVVPQFGGMQANALNFASGAIEGFSGSATEFLAYILTTLFSGKVAQNLVEKSIGGTVNALAGSEEKEQTNLLSGSDRKALPAKKQGVITQISNQAADQIRGIDPEYALKRGQEIVQTVRDSYSVLNDALKGKSFSIADNQIKLIEGTSKQAKDQITTLVKTLESQGSLSGKKKNQLNQLKSTISRLTNEAVRKIHDIPKGAVEKQAEITEQELNSLIQDILTIDVDARAVDLDQDALLSISDLDAAIEELNQSISDELYSFSDITKAIRALIDGTNSTSANPEEIKAKAEQLIKSLEDKLSSFNVLENQINFNSDQAEENLKASLDNLETPIENFMSRVKRILNVNPIINQFSNSFKTLGKIALPLTPFLVLGAVFVKFRQQIGEFIKDSNQLARTYETLSTRIKNFSSSPMKGEQNINFVRSEADRLSLGYGSSMQSFADLAATTKGTQYEGDFTNQLFTGLNEIGRTRGSSQTDLEGATRAITQIITKGEQVYAEELIGQLAERIPGIVAVAARGMGMEQGELRANLTSGAIKTSQFLPALLGQAQAEASIQLGSALDTSQVKLDDFSNSIEDFQLTFGQLSLPVENLRLEVLTRLLDFATEHLDEFIRVATTIGGVLLFRALFPNGFVATVQAVVKAMQMLPSILSTTGGGLSKTIPLVRSFMLQFAGLTAVITAFEILGKVFEDKGGKLREFADQGIADLKRLNNELTKTKNLAENTRIPVGKSYLEQSGAGSMLPTNVSRRLEDVALSRGDEQALSEINRLSGTENSERISKYEEAYRKDRLRAADEFLGANQYNLDSVNSLLNSQGRGSTPLQRNLENLLSNQDTLQTLQARRNNLAPGDTEKRQQLTGQISALLESNQVYRAPIAELQTRIAADIEEYKAAIQELETDLARPETTAEYADELNKRLEKTKSQLKDAEKAQNNLNKALKDAIPSAKMLEKTFALLTNRLQDNNVQIQLAASKQQELVALNQLTRKATPGQSQYLNDLQQQLLLTEQIKNNNQAIVDIQKELQNVGITEALAAFELDTNINNLKPTDIEAALKERTAETPEREILESVALPQLRNLAQLQLDTQNLQTQIAQSRVQAQEQLKQSTREIAEYFKGIYRQSQEVALAAKQSGLEVQAIEAKNKLRAGLKGFGNRFFGEFIDNILQLTEKLFEPLQNKLDLEQSLQQYQNQYADNLTQGNQLGQNAYGGAQSFTPYQVITPQGGNVDSHDDLTPHHDYQQTELGEVRDFTLLQNDNSRVPVPSPVTGTVDYVGDDPDGYGNFVDIRTLAGELVRLAHFDSLAVTQGESVNAGQPLGMQGSTGGSTGDHVHIEGPPNVIAQYMTALNTGNFGNQQTQSNAPAVFNNVGSSLSGGVDIVALRRAIMGQESGGNATIQNVDTGAAGLYQIMPENIGPWSEQTVGRRVGLEEFLGNPELQTQIANGMMEKMLATALQNSGGNLETAVRMVAAEWYSGQQSLYNDTAPQDGYPSIQSYTYDVLDKYKAELGNSGGSTGSGTNTQGIQQGQNLAAQNLNTQTQSALELMAARDAQDALETEQLVQQINKSSRTRRESLSDEVLNQQRQQEDLLYESQVKTPEIEYQRQSTLNLRGFDDRTRDTSRTIRELTEGIEAAELIRERLVNNPLYADVLPQILPGIDEEIKVSKEKLAELEEIYNEERTVYETQQKFLDEQYQRQEKARRLQARQRSISTDNQLLGVIAQSERYNGRGMQAITYEGIAQRQQIDLDFETQTNELENLLYQGEITNEEFEKMRNTLMQIRDISLSNLNEQLRVSQEELQRNSLGQLFNSKMAIGQEQLQTYSLYGVQNPDLERDLAIEQQNFSFQQQVDEINRAVEAGQLLAETATQIKANLEAVNQVKLNNIETQFSPYTTAAQYASQAFQQLGVNLLTSSGTIQDVLKNIMNQFANFAMQLLANELFGMLLGGGGSLFGGGGKGKGVATASPTAGTLVSSIFSGMGSGGSGMFGSTQAPSTGSSLISTGISLLGSFFGGGFAEGGIIPELNKNKNKIPGSSPIGKALRREGSGGVIAVFNPKERVLSIEQNRLFEQGYSYSEIFGRDVPNFKEGSHRSSFSPDPGLVSKNYEINVPVSYNGSGSPSEDDKNEMAMMGERIRGAVKLVLKEELKPNGMVDKKIRGR